MTMNDEAYDFLTGPPVYPDRREEILSPEQVAELACTQSVRSIARGFGRVIWESEAVTRDDRYGHIYRYDVDTEIDDGAGRKQISRGRIVISTEAPDKILLSCHSLFELQ